MSFTVGMLATALLPELNRRPQFILGALSIALHMFFLGLDNFLGLSATISSLNYLPIIILISFGINFDIGIGTIPFTLYWRNIRTTKDLLLDGFMFWNEWHLLDPGLCSTA